MGALFNLITTYYALLNNKTIIPQKLKKLYFLLKNRGDKLPYYYYSITAPRPMLTAVPATTVTSNKPVMLIIPSPKSASAVAEI